ncbi:MAG TPA: LytTR family DNA-binding domain-containing protein [Paludibacter sp.]|nr:LytTR family DNA-binding domain-containing protein [Paludibacter sp.]
MIQTLFESKVKLQQYIFMWIGYAVLHALSALMLVQFSLIIIITDALIYAALLGSTGILIISVLKYANFNQFSFFQRIVNYSALFLLAIIITVSVSFGVIHLIFGSNVSGGFIPLIAVRSFIALLVYNLIVAQFKISEMKRVDVIESVTEDENIQTPEILSGEIQQTINNELIDRVAVKSGQKIHVVPVDEIYCIQADSDYVHIYTKEHKYMKEQTMKYFEEHLPSNKFVRIHRSCIVNIESISRIDLYEKQTQQLTLKNGQQIKVSQAGYKLLRMKLNL